MNAELDKFMAEVMGWSKVLIYNVWRYAESAEKYINYIDWHPTEDLNQAMRCVEECGVEIRLFGNPVTTQKKWSMYCGLRARDLDREEIPLAICEAIVSAIKGANE